LEAGHEIGPYRLLFRIGKGGMGEVWAAQLRKDVGFSKVVALKTVPAPSFEETGVMMFVDEAKVSAALSHPSIVPAFDFGSDGDTAYIAMELVRGPSLNVLLGRLARSGTRLSPGIVVHIGERVATALDYAYRRATVDGRPLRLIHRDVSPQNILVDAHGHVRLTDFGIARTTIQRHVTRAGIFRGKPGYLSPEQILGRDLDDRSDVFALGVVLYECAACARLFAAADVEESLDATLDEAAVPLDERIAGFPRDLSKIIDRALSKHPHHRQDGTGQLAAELSAVGRALEGNAAKELGDLVGRTFTDEDFDVDVRIADALAALEETRIRPKGDTRSMRRPTEWPSLMPDAVIPRLSLPPPEPEDTAEDPVDTRNEHLLRDVSTAALEGKAESRALVAFASVALVVAAGGSIYFVASRTGQIEPAPVVAPARPGVISAPDPARPVAIVARPPGVEPPPPLDVPPPIVERPPEPRNIRPSAAADAGVSTVANEEPPSARAWRAIVALERIDPAEGSRMKVVYAEAVAAGDRQKLLALAIEVEQVIARTRSDRP
jgi:serine/threonine-protein kinase